MIPPELLVSNDNDARDSKIIHRWRLPLHLALSISPLYLLLPIDLGKKDCGRGVLWKVSDSNASVIFRELLTFFADLASIWK